MSPTSPPDPVGIYEASFRLNADPGALEAAAAAIRELGSLALTAQDTVDNAANLVRNAGLWEGDAAAAYQSHRRALTSDLGELNGAVVSAAETLEHVAAVLRLSQDALDTQKERLAGIAVTDTTGMGPGSPGTLHVYQPADERQATILSEVVTAIGDIRRGANEQLAAQESAFQQVLNGATVPDPRLGNRPGLTGLAEAWPPLPEILNEYQVAEDGMAEIGVEGPGGYGGSTRLTESEWELLQSQGLLAVAMWDIRGTASGEAENRFPGSNPDDSHRNAFQHAYWNALMAWYYGQEFAAEYGTAHERIPTDEVGAHADREAMDLYNNEVGRRIAAEHPGASPAELADLVQEAVRNGELVVIDQYGDLAYSDGVPERQTGAANDAPRRGGDHPTDFPSGELA